MQRQTILNLHQRLEWLERCYHERGTFRIAHKNKRWSTKWREWSSTEEWLKRNANLRELFSDEVVLDFDAPTTEECSDLAVDAALKLCEDGFYYGLWFTGSKGYHLHMRFDEMKDLDVSKRKQVRLWLIEKFSTDRSKQSGLIAIEHKPHFKTGKPKILQIDNYSTQNNKIPAEALKLLKKNERKHAINLETNYTQDDSNQHPFVRLVKSQIWHDDKGLNRWKLVKQLAIIGHKTGYTEDEFSSWCTQFSKHLPGKSTNEFLGWFRWARRHSNNG